jgi:hypothetical protein
VELGIVAPPGASTKDPSISSPHEPSGSLGAPEVAAVEAVMLLMTETFQPEEVARGHLQISTVIRITMIETYLAVRSRSRPRRTFFIKATVS